MEHMCSTKEDEYHFINPNKEKGLNSSYEEEPPLFLDFPSPFFDEISTDQRHPIDKPLSNNMNTDQPSSESNQLIKKRSVGKKDRHSKIHTAQGLRDRRMRLSLHIARKFFDLQDLLGFDKASKTIEWLFCKSKKAIKEVAENFNPQHTNQRLNEDMDMMHSLMSESREIKGATRKVEIKKRKRNQNNSRETRDQARARARDRTRERLMIKELEKQLFEGNPKDEIYKLGIGYSASPNNNNNHIVEELGSTSSPSQPIQLQQHSTSTTTTTHHHFLQEQLQLANKNFDGSIPEGWQSSIDGFLGVPGEWDANNFITDSCNYEGMVPTLTGDIYEQNPSSFYMSITTNILHF